jgi:hypothetical protein
MSGQTISARRWSRIVLVGVVALAITMAGSAGRADGPPGPGPYPAVALGADAGFFTCGDVDGTVLYSAPAWTLEPLARGPLFAPVVLWLAGAINQPVVPLEFVGEGFPMGWQTVDGGPAEAGNLELWRGRPVGYGPPPTDPAPRVTCRYSYFGSFEFGTYRITAGLRAVLGLPAGIVGRVVAFDNEGQVTFTVPRTLFPLTADVLAPALPTPTAGPFNRRPLPTTTCRRGAATVYRGSAYTLAPLVRGYQWAPMAFWLAGDRVTTPLWFSSRVQGMWRTVAGSPARSGRLDAAQAGRPAGYGRRPLNATGGVDCGWSGGHATTTTVSLALATQLRLPGNLIGRQVELRGTYSAHAFVPAWLFPPAA